MQLDNSTADSEANSLDSDVAAEAERVKRMIETGEAQNVIVTVSELRKTFIVKKEVAEEDENPFADAKVVKSRTK